jgi:hypothetical protein
MDYSNDDDDVVLKNSTTIDIENIGFGCADIYDVAELLELSRINLTDKEKREESKDTDEIIKELKSGCVSQSSKRVYESANIIFYFISTSFRNI